MDMAFFGEMAWKSALISAAALMLAYVLRSRAAADRALVLRIGVAMLLLLPVIALALPALPIEAWAAPAAAPAAAAAAPFLYIPGAEVSPSYLVDPGLQPAAPSIWDDPTPLVLLAYLGGLAMVGARLLAGLVMLGRWTRAAREVTCPEWLAAFERARWAAPDGERLRLMVSDTVPSPLSWGWRRPVILIDPDTLDEPEEAAAILAHEVAHVARRDWPVLMVTRLVATLFWFNPLVWLLDREIVQQAEEAADREAADAVEPARYARTLLSLAQVNGRMVPANSIAPSGSALSRRVQAILDRRLRERPSGSAWTGIAAVLCIGIAAPVAAMQLVEAAGAPEAPGAPQAPIAPTAPFAAPHAPGAGLPPAPPAAPHIPDVAPIVHEALAEVLPQIPQIVAEATAAVDPKEIEDAIEEALRESRAEVRMMSGEDRARFDREIRRAVAVARSPRVRVPRVHVDSRAIEAAIAQAHHAAAIGPRAIAISMASGSASMIHGATGMEAGARQMERQAAQFRDRNYRERAIARAAARGEQVTHQDLLEAAQGLEEGAQGMREGAREMRQAAEDMRGGHD
jgi:beta-lactamase regulating signal transducer with metallopeptidase domain